MKAYAAYLIAALSFYTWGVLSAAAGKALPGCALVALGSVCFAIALARRKKARKEK